MRQFFGLLGVLVISVFLMACGDARNEQNAVEQIRQESVESESESLESPEKAGSEADTEIQTAEQTETEQTEVNQTKTEQTEVNPTEDEQMQIQQTEVSQTEDEQMQTVQIEGNQIQENQEQTEQEEENDMKMNIQIGENLLTATLVKNSSTDALVEMLSEGPVTIAMNDYASMEKVGPFPKSLPRNDEQISTGAGDLILYQGNSFVIYYDTNSWNFTRLGKVDNVTKQELMDILGSGSVTAVLSLPTE